MKVSKKLTIGFTVALVAAVTIGIIGIMGMRTLRDSALYMYENRMLGSEYVHEAYTNFNLMRIESRNVRINSFYDDKKGAIDSRQVFEDSAGQFIYWMEKSREIATTEELIKFHDVIMDLFINSYLPKARATNDICINDIPDHHNRLYINVQIAATAKDVAQINNLLTGLASLNTALANQSNIDNTSLVRLNIMLQVCLLAGAVGFVIIIAFFIIKSIVTPINESALVLKEIAQGNFEARMGGNYKGDFRIIKESVNDTALQLSSYLDEKILAERAAHESELAKARAEAASEAVFSSISYASTIQRNMLPLEIDFKEAFTDFSVIWEPRDVVGGDIYWMKEFDIGTVLCVADCTGHGTSGALLTMLTVSALESIVWVANCEDTAAIIYQLDQRLASALNVQADVKAKLSEVNDGCDIAVLFIAKNGSVMFSAGNTNIFVCDGKQVTRFKGQKLFVGEGKIKSRDDIDIIELPPDSDNKFYIASDGLFDQLGGSLLRPFGYGRFETIILENHSEPLAVISSKVWESFEEYRGSEVRVDDIELITFKP